ncbi:TPA: hypothetical protein ACH3X1_007300 [Trebouxia sp. C0004]
MLHPSKKPEAKTGNACQSAQALKRTLSRLTPVTSDHIKDCFGRYPEPLQQLQEELHHSKEGETQSNEGSQKPAQASVSSLSFSRPNGLHALNFIAYVDSPTQYSA